MKLSRASALSIIATLICALVICSCTNKKDLAQRAEIMSKLETEDHDFCIGLGLDHNGNDDLKVEAYWRCRQDLAESKLIKLPKTRDQLETNKIINETINRIKKNLSNSFLESPLGRNEKISAIDHNTCMKAKFSPYTTDRSKVEDYLTCRRDLVQEFNSLIPFGNKAYKGITGGYSIVGVIDSVIDADKSASDKIKMQYNDCKNFHFRSEKFLKCRQAQDKAKMCFKKIKNSELGAILKEDGNCQLLAYYHFPNSMMRPEDRRKKDNFATKKSEIQSPIVTAQINVTFDNERKYNEYINQTHNGEGVDPQNIQSIDTSTNPSELLTSIKSKILGDSAKDKPKDKESDIKYQSDKMDAETLKKINTKDGLYTRIELIRLRLSYIELCRKEASKNLQKVFSDKGSECSAISRDF